MKVPCAQCGRIVDRAYNRKNAVCEQCRTKRLSAAYRRRRAALKPHGPWR